MVIKLNKETLVSQLTDNAGLTDYIKLKIMKSICPLTNKVIGIWSNVPGYYTSSGLFIRYEKYWFCNTNKTSHTNLKQRLNCIHCNNDYKIKYKL